MIASFVSLGAFGATDDKVAHAQKLTDALEDLRLNRYMKKGDEHQAAYDIVCDIIIPYEGEISSCITKDDKTVEHMELLYHKGVSEGILTWIYYSQSEDAEGERAAYEADMTDVSNPYYVYLSKLEIIRSKVEISDIDYFTPKGDILNDPDNYGAEVEKCFSELFNAIYRKKIAALLIDGDCDAVKNKISSADDSISGVGYQSVDKSGSLPSYSIHFGEDGQNYKKYFEDTEKEVLRLRNRNEMDLELREAFKIIYPSEDFDVFVDANGYMLNYRSKFKDIQTISEMNALLSHTVEGLLRGLRGDDADSFRYAYLEGKALEVSRAISDNGNAKIADIFDCFKDYTLKLYSADKKDSLTAFADMLKSSHSEYTQNKLLKLDALVKEYTDGIFDKQTNIADIDRELERAKDRLLWTEVYFEASDKIIGYVGAESPIKAEADKLYLDTDKAITEGERDGTSLFEERLKEDIASLYALCSKAEAALFTDTHKAIIEKPLDDITKNDKTALIAAIADAEGLSAEAEKLLEASLLDIGEKYKAAAKNSIDGILETEGKRKALNEELDGLIDGLSSKDNASFALKKLQEAADVIENKAKELDGLLDVYENEYLPMGTEFFGGEAERIVDDASRKIIYEGDEEKTKNDAISALRALAKRELDAAKSKADGELGALAEQLKNTVNGYKYITDTEKSSYVSAIDALVTDAKAGIGACGELAEINDILNAAKADMNGKASEAAEAERLACLDDAKSTLNSCYGSRDDFSDANYADILELINEYTSRLESASSVAEYEKIRDEGVERILTVEDKLEEARRLGEEKLKAEYGALSKNKELYSEAAFASLTAIYNDAILKLGEFSSMSELDALNALVENTIPQMRGIYLDRLYTSDLLFKDNANPTIPDGYDPSKNGFSGVISSEGGIPFGMLLKINMGSLGNAETLIQKAAKNKLIKNANGSSLSKDILKKLKRCEVIAALDFDLGELALLSDKSYAVSVLLPKGTDMSEIVGIVFINEDGSIEFYDVNAEGATIDFTTKHFSKYYVVSRGQVNLLPWIICLSIILLCEVIFVGILLLRRKKKQSAAPLYSMLAPFMLSVRYSPKGGLAVVVALSVGVVILGGAIAYLLYLELKDRRKVQRLKCPEEAPVLVTVGESTLPVKEESPRLSESILEPLPSVSVSEADTLMSDVEVREIQEEMSGYIDTEVYRGLKKAEINIDTISEMFDGEETVTLNSLKKKKLIGNNVGFVKVLARGSVNKPLTVVAQDFSTAAAKMLFLTGGRAINTYESLDRQARKK